MHRRHRTTLLASTLPWLALACGTDARRPGATSSATSIATDAGSQTEDSGESSSASAETASASASTSATSSPGDDTSTSAASTVTETGGSTGPGESTGAPSSICDDIAGEDFIVPDSCDGPSGNTSTEIPANGLFATSWFGCYLGDDGEIVQDPGDNCEFACGSKGLCPGQDGPTCEANLQWFAADADRYGCGGRIRVTNCDNGNAVVLVTLDRGPNCESVEMQCGAPVLDMSHDAMVYLFDGGIYGGCDLQAVAVEEVDDATPLGPV